MLLASAAAVATALAMASPVQAADQILSGTITAAGQKLNGVTVSAKREGSTITTSVYTDDSGNYYFPPMEAGKYQVWAQTIGYDASKSEVDLSANKHADFALKAITDPEARWRQLPSELMMASLPEATPEDAHMKQIFMNQCNGCHTPSYPLQFKFDQTGWSRIIDLMKVIGGEGVPQRPANQILSMNQKRLAAYLAKVRGPDSKVETKERPRPTGDAARAVWTLYDVPRLENAGVRSLGLDKPDADGSDWSKGTPTKVGLIIHDDAMDLNGNILFTSNTPNKIVSVGMVDAKTGKITYHKIERADGKGAATTHGLTRDAKGNLWFDINPGRRSLGTIDVKTGKITVYPTPASMSPVGGAVTVDVDGKGMIWVSAPDGVLRFDPQTAQFMDFHDSAYKRPQGIGATYGAAGDRYGNGWWAEMGWDTVGKADPETGKITEIKLPATALKAKLPQQDIASYDKITDISTGNPYPWAQGPRRMGTDKNGDVLWVGDSWGSNLAKIDVKTNKVEIVPFPDRAMQPYHIMVDKNHNVWGNLWTADELFRYNPSTKQWATFPLPVRGTEIRHLSVYDQPDGSVKVSMPVYRTNQMGVMTIRSEADIAKLRQQVASK
jgi:streptogramin lyase/mono/diheme cytochrome c family protein